MFFTHVAVGMKDARGMTALSRIFVLVVRRLEVKTVV
jgi:hypothetical protein